MCPYPFFGGGGSGWSPNDILALRRLHRHVAAPHGGRWNCWLCVFSAPPTQYCRKLKTNNCGCGCVFLNPMTPFCPWKTSDDLKTTRSRGIIIPHSCSSFVGELRVNSSSAHAGVAILPVCITPRLCRVVRRRVSAFFPPLSATLSSSTFSFTQSCTGVQCQGSKRSRNIKKWQVQEINTENSTLVEILSS